ncbi:MAG: hypothetical protein R2854_29185 [Caldilineaceae bacterium]
MTNPESFGANTTNGRQLRLILTAARRSCAILGLVLTMPPAERCAVGVELHGLPGLLSLQDSLE